MLIQIHSRPLGQKNGILLANALEVQQFHLTRERYAALMNDLQARIVQEVQASQESQAGKWHTIALLGFPGVMLPMSEGNEK